MVSSGDPEVRRQLQEAQRREDGRGRQGSHVERSGKEGLVVDREGPQGAQGKPVGMSPCQTGASGKDGEATTTGSSEEMNEAEPGFRDLEITHVTEKRESQTRKGTSNDKESLFLRRWQSKQTGGLVQKEPYWRYMDGI